jgi:hypothetical protein
MFNTSAYSSLDKIHFGLFRQYLHFQFMCFRVCDLLYRVADKSLARPTSRRILFDGENISFDASLFIYTNSTNFPPIMIINRTYEHQNLLSL